MDIYKIAQKYENNISESNAIATAMQNYVAILRGLALIHQHAHWHCKSREYYGDHLLFDRLYTAVVANVDTAAEKTIGVFGDNLKDGQISLEGHTELVNKFVRHVISQSNEKDAKFLLAKRSLVAEEIFLKYSEDLYNKLKKSNKITLGVDDMIMSIASAHEENVYLLKQRLKKY